VLASQGTKGENWEVRRQLEGAWCHSYWEEGLEEMGKLFGGWCQP